jgi:hypothetical protein
MGYPNNIIRRSLKLAPAERQRMSDQEIYNRIKETKRSAQAYAKLLGWVKYTPYEMHGPSPAYYFLLPCPDKNQYKSHKDVMNHLGYLYTIILDKV